MDYHSQVNLEFKLKATLVKIIKQVSDFIQLIIKFFTSSNSEILSDLFIIQRENKQLQSRVSII